MIDLHELLLPADWQQNAIEQEARRIYFEELVPKPPILPEIKGMENLPLEITNSEGAFRHIFGESKGWTSYCHSKTGALDSERMRRIHWIRAVLELKAKGIKIYVNYHSMKPREHGDRVSDEKKRIYVVTQTGLLYFISLKYLPKSFVLTSAFTPEGRWVREMQKKHGTTLLWPSP
jgi:hypothetical protein